MTDVRHSGNGKPRKQIHLAAHFPGVNNTTVWSDPRAGSHIEFSSFLRFAQIAACMIFVLPAVLGTYAFLATKARQLFTTPKAVRRLNRSSGIAMAGAAVVVATR